MYIYKDMYESMEEFLYVLYKYYWSQILERKKHLTIPWMAGSAAGTCRDKWLEKQRPKGWLLRREVQ